MGATQNGLGLASANADTPAARRGTWAIEYPRDQLPDLPLDQVLWQAFEHFAHTDMANAATHLSGVRWSPLTFRLADQLDAMGVEPHLAGSNARLLEAVQTARGQYPEDRGRAAED